MDTETPDTLRVICNMWVVSRNGPLVSLYVLLTAEAPNLIHEK